MAVLDKAKRKKKFTLNKSTKDKCPDPDKIWDPNLKTCVDIAKEKKVIISELPKKQQKKALEFMQKYSKQEFEAELDKLSKGLENAIETGIKSGVDKALSRKEYVRKEQEKVLEGDKDAVAHPGTTWDSYKLHQKIAATLSGKGKYSIDKKTGKPLYDRYSSDKIKKIQKERARRDKEIKKLEQLEEDVDIIVDDTETLTVEEEAQLDKDVKVLQGGFMPIEDANEFEKEEITGWVNGVFIKPKSKLEGYEVVGIRNSTDEKGEEVVEYFNTQEYVPQSYINPYKKRNVTGEGLRTLEGIQPDMNIIDVESGEYGRLDILLYNPTTKETEIIGGIANWWDEIELAEAVIETPTEETLATREQFVTEMDDLFLQNHRELVVDILMGKDEGSLFAVPELGGSVPYIVPDIIQEDISEMPLSILTSSFGSSLMQGT